MRSPCSILALSLALFTAGADEARAGVAVIPCALVCPAGPTIVAEGGDAAVVEGGAQPCEEVVAPDCDSADEIDF